MSLLEYIHIGKMILGGIVAIGIFLIIQTYRRRH